MPIAILLLLALGLPAILLGANRIVPGTVRADRPTLHHLGLRLPYTDDDNANAVASVRFRAVGSTVWRNGLDLFRVLPRTVIGFAAAQEFAGTIFDLLPGTTYQAEITISDPDGAFVQTQTLTIATRAVPPAEPAQRRTVSVSTAAALEDAANNAQPGDVIVVAPGTYTLEYLALANSGTAANPIILRGADRSTVILSGGNCSGCNVVELFGSFTTVENLTIQNAQQGLRFVTPNAVGQTVRNVTFTDVINGINGKPGQLDTLIADNILVGRIPSSSLTISPSPAPNAYGMQILGQGVVVMHNRISGFEDGVRVFESGARSIDILNNDIFDLVDDGIELDSGAGNIRALRNHIRNVSSGISTQPVYGGPTYLVRNVGRSIRQEQVKFHSTGGGNPNHPSGVLAFHNTFFSNDRPLQMYSSNPGYNSSFRNNIFIGPTILSDGIAAYWTGPRFDVRFDNNGYYPDGQFRFREGYGSLVYPSHAAMKSAGLLEGQGTLLTLPLLSGTNIGELAATSNALDRAFPLANLNSEFSGGGPDLGAYERGCRPSSVGPRATIDPLETGTFGSCAPGAQLPTVTSVSPRVGGGLTQSFAFQFSDPDGVADIGVVNVLINGFLDGRNACYLAYDRPSGVLYVVNDAGNDLRGLTLPGNGSVSNGQCTVLGAGSSAVAAGNTLTLTLSIQFHGASFAGRKVLYTASRDLSANNSQWQPLGVYQVGALPASVPAVVAISPSAADTSAATFTITYRDATSAANLRAAQLLINQALDGRGACFLGYDALSNALYLLSDAGALLPPAIQPGVSVGTTLENSQCRVDATGTTRAVSGTDLLLTVRLTFKPAFAGPKILYGGVQSVGGNSNWQAIGVWGLQ